MFIKEKQTIVFKIKEILKDDLSSEDLEKLTIDFTLPKNHGDLSTNIAMKLSKQLSDNPVNIANKIAEKLTDIIIEKIEVANPGFLNIFLSDKAFYNVLENIEETDDYGKGEKNKKINIEYVSANPTGYLHIGHARNAVIGSSLSSLLRYAGYQVDEEFYINDAGNQMKVLGQSVKARYLEILGQDLKLPKDSYQGDDIKDAAQIIFNEINKDEKSDDYFIDKSKNIFLKEIKKDLEFIGCFIPNYFSEKQLYLNDNVKNIIKSLPNTYSKDGAFWLETTKFFDDKDRVLIKADGTFSYFAPDIAYHNNKIKRGYDFLINLWGSDHIGYKDRILSAIENMGYSKDKIDLIFMQNVRLVKDGKEFKMSKRNGTSYWLRDFISLVGKDNARFYLIDASLNSGIDFDLDKIKEKTAENILYTIKYSFARANQLLEKSKTSTIQNNDNYSWDDKEKIIIKHLSNFPEIIELSSSSYKVNLLSVYVKDLTRMFNSYYTNSKIIGDNDEFYKIMIVKNFMKVIEIGMNILGISLPKKM